MKKFNPYDLNDVANINKFIKNKKGESKMTKFLVKSFETVYYETWVDADTPKEAQEIVEAGDGDVIDRTQVTNSSDFEVWDVLNEDGYSVQS